jgi:aspartyl-tRNA(Asn)/glutamyl-tRNA(Gln) amidotransferase subunit A
MRSAEVQRRIAIGRHAVSAQVISQFHGKAQSVRSGIQHEFAETFTRVDMLLTPTGTFRFPSC